MSTCKARVAFNNLLEVSDQPYEVSSEQVNFPRANLIHPDRTKVFRFAGSTEISNAIRMVYASTGDFAIPLGRYTQEDLANYIDTALGGNWTFLYDPAVKRFAVRHATSGVLTMSNQSSAVWYALGFGQTADLTVGTTYIYGDEVRAHYPNEYVQVDTGFDATARFCGLIADSAKSLQLSPSAVVKLLGNDHGDFDTLSSTEFTMEWTDKGIFQFFNEDEAYTHRYWRLVVEDVRNTEEIEIGHLFFGDYEQMPSSKNFDTGFQVDIIDPSTLAETDGGQVYGNKKRKYLDFTSLSVGLAKPEVIAFFKRIFGATRTFAPFYFALDPQGHISSDIYEHTAFVRFVEGPSYKQVIRDLYSLSVRLREVV